MRHPESSKAALPTAAKRHRFEQCQPVLEERWPRRWEATTVVGERIVKRDVCKVNDPPRESSAAPSLIADVVMGKPVANKQ
jgi:hypothetical protein